MCGQYLMRWIYAHSRTILAYSDDEHVRPTAQNVKYIVGWLHTLSTGFRRTDWIIGCHVMRRSLPTDEMQALCCCQQCCQCSQRHETNFRSSEGENEVSCRTRLRARTNDAC